mgnify:CR=1 FL=1
MSLSRWSCRCVPPLTATFALGAISCAVLAQTAPEVIITGSIAERAAAEAPFAINLVEREAFRSAGPMLNLSETMARVPGLVVSNRSNYAQDLQISSRGFGARAGFGVRGIRLYSDGIPASGPDGQGQVSHYDIAGAQRVEVLRGPFSVLYGNSSGGVISLISAPARRAEFELEGDVGSFGLHQLRFGVASPFGEGFDFRAGVSTMEIDGFRPQSSAQRTLGNLRLGWNGPADSVTLLVNEFTSCRGRNSAESSTSRRRTRWDCRVSSSTPTPTRPPPRHCSSTPARPPARASSAPAGSTASATVRCASRSWPCTAGSARSGSTWPSRRAHRRRRATAAA